MAVGYRDILEYREGERKELRTKWKEGRDNGQRAPGLKYRITSR